MAPVSSCRQEKENGGVRMRRRTSALSIRGDVADGLTQTGRLDDTAEKSVTYYQYTFIFVTGHYIEQECFRPVKHGFYGFGPVVYFCTCFQDIHTRERSPIPFAKERCGFKKQAVRFVEYHSGVHTAFQVAAQ